MLLTLTVASSLSPAFDTIDEARGLAVAAAAGRFVVTFAAAREGVDRDLVTVEEGRGAGLTIGAGSSGSEVGVVDRVETGFVVSPRRVARTDLRRTSVAIFVELDAAGQCGL